MKLLTLALLALTLSLPFGLSSDLLAPLLVRAELLWGYGVGAKAVWSSSVAPVCSAGANVMKSIIPLPLSGEKRIELNVHCRFTVQTLSTMQEMVTHETGHFLGVPHSKDFHSVMYWQSDGQAVSITPGDQSAVTLRPMDALRKPAEEKK